MQFGTDRDMTIKEIAKGFRYRLGGLEPRDGIMVPYNGMRMLLDELDRLWAVEAAATEKAAAPKPKKDAK